MSEAEIREKEKQEEIRTLISEKAEILVIDQAREMLKARTLTMLEELNYVKDRLARAEKKLGTTTSAMKEIEPRVVKSANLLSEYREEKETISAESEQYSEVREKVNIISERKPLVETRADEVRKLEGKQKILQRKYKTALNSRESTERELQSATDTRNALEKEIRTLKEKRDTFVAGMPEYKSAYELKKEQAKAEKEIRQYTAQLIKVKEQFSSVDTEASGLRKAADDRIAEKASLTTRQAELEPKIKDLANVEDREGLVAEIKDLQNTKQALLDDRESTKKEKTRLGQSIADLEKSAEKEKEFAATAEERLLELKEQKEEIDNAEYVIKMTKLNTDVNEKFVKIVSSITEHMGPLSKSLDKMAKDYKKFVTDLEKTVKKKI